MSNKKPIIIGIIAIVLYLIGMVFIILDSKEIISIINISFAIGFNISSLPSLFILSGIVVAIYGVIRYPKNNFLLGIFIIIIASLIVNIIVSSILAFIKNVVNKIFDCLTCGGLG